MLCMLTCILGLSGCGQAPSAEVEAYEKMKCEIGAILANNIVVPYMMDTYYGAEDTTQAQNAEYHQAFYNVHELADVTEDNLNTIIDVLSQSMGSNPLGIVDNIEVDGNGIRSGIVSIESAYASLGEVDLSSRTFDYKVSGDQIIVSVYLTGSKVREDGKTQTATMEVILTNDIFMEVEACTLNLDQSMSELMTKAGMDTLMGMSIVFIVLILISILIWALGLIPKLQAMFNGTNKTEKVQTIKEEAVDKTIAQIIEKEESAVVNATDDLELVAVIAAAIAASQGAVSTDGFVVRSIRKRR